MMHPGRAGPPATPSTSTIPARDGASGAILRISRNVRHLARATAFYENRLGFARHGPPEALDALTARLWGDTGATLHRQRLRLGATELELVDVGGGPGMPYPRDSRSDDLAFQHFAVRCGDVAAAFARLYQDDAASDPPRAISHDGAGMPRPIALPARSGGVTAFKFRDPDGHPVELLGPPAHASAGASPAAPGIDHSAIGVSNAMASVRFYRRWLGCAVQARQRNAGVEQDRLDGLRDARVDVVALRTPVGQAPHLELLGYHRAPRAPSGIPDGPGDIVSDRLVIAVDDPQAWRRTWMDAGLPVEAAIPDAVLVRDPDRHLLMLTRRTR